LAKNGQAANGQAAAAATATAPSQASEKARTAQADQAARAAASQVDLDQLAAAERARTNELSRLIDQITQALEKSKVTVGVAPSDPRERANAEREIAREIEHGRLASKRLRNGDIAYTIPGDTVRTAGGLLGTREAFVERGLRTAHPYIEVTGASDRQIAAAMAHAARRWQGDDVIIHADMKHEQRIIKHAVAAGLNVVNKDERIQKLVAEERERQAKRGHVHEQKDRTPVIERVPSGMSR
jgi:hypothetical protein